MQNQKVYQNSQNNNYVQTVRPLVPPPEESVNAVFNRLQFLGLYENQSINLSRDLVSIIISASNEMMHMSLSQRRELLAYLLPMTEEHGQSDQIYEVADTNPREIVQGDKVKFYQTAFVNGRFVSPTHLDPYDVDKAPCAVCGAEVHCWKEQRNTSGNLIIMCNHCMYSSDDVKIRTDSKGLRGCENCTVMRCPRHPLSTRR